MLEDETETGEIEFSNCQHILDVKTLLARLHKRGRFFNPQTVTVGVNTAVGLNIMLLGDLIIKKRGNFGVFPK